MRPKKGRVSQGRPRAAATARGASGYTWSSYISRGLAEDTCMSRPFVISPRAYACTRGGKQDGDTQVGGGGAGEQCRPTAAPTYEGVISRGEEAKRGYTPGVAIRRGRENGLPGRTVPYLSQWPVALLATPGPSAELLPSTGQRTYPLPLRFVGVHTSVVMRH